MCVRTHAQEKTLWIWRWKTGLLLLDAARVSEVAKLAVGSNQQMPCSSQPQTAHLIRKRTLKGTEHTCKLQSRHMDLVVIIHIYRIYDRNTARTITPGLLLSSKVNTRLNSIQTHCHTHTEWPLCRFLRFAKMYYFTDTYNNIAGLPHSPHQLEN